MSAEIVRRRLVVRFSGLSDNAYTDKVTEKIVALEKQLNTEIEFINKPHNETIVVKMQNGDAYEFYGWRDPYKDNDKRPPANYKPPEAQYKKLSDTVVVQDAETSEFSIFHFVFLVLFLGLVFLGGILTWHVIK